MLPRRRLAASGRARLGLRVGLAAGRAVRCEHDGAARSGATPSWGRSAPSQRTNELSARQAAVAQRMSAYALLFAIPNALFALYGTNFQHLPKILTADYGYPTLLGITLILMAVTAWRLRHNGWL